MICAVANKRDRWCGEGEADTSLRAWTNSIKNDLNKIGLAELTYMFFYS